MILFLYAPAHGQFIYEFTEVFDGQQPQSAPPWLTSAFSSPAPGQVELTVTALNLYGDENIRNLYFNLNPAYDPSQLQFSFIGGAGAYTIPSIHTRTDGFKAGGDGYYDLQITFATAMGAEKRFTVGDSVKIAITGLPALTAGDFAFLSTPAGGHGPFYAAAHVQRIGQGSQSGWIYPVDGPKNAPVPEPSSAALAGLATLLTLMRCSWKP